MVGSAVGCDEVGEKLGITVGDRDGLVLGFETVGRMVGPLVGT